jgi:glucose-6-phosphate isomerase
LPAFFKTIAALNRAQGESKGKFYKEKYSEINTSKAQWVQIIVHSLKGIY